MMKKTFITAFWILPFFACSSPRKTAVYSPSRGGFSCKIPGDWRVLENQGGAHRVSFFGPTEGPHPYSVSITVFYYDSRSSYPTPEAYYKMESMSGGITSPLKQETTAGRNLYSFSTSRKSQKLHSDQIEELKEDTFIIPTQNGFYALAHTAPEASARDTEPVFMDFVKSFKP